jgi:predicted DNA-binding transcriptional regulator YafY
MKRSRSQVERLLDLDQKLRGGTYPNCSNFAKDWEISTKTVQRDLEFLQDRLGAPLAYDHSRRGYYYTEATFMLPTLQMNEGELVALLLSTRILSQFQGTPMAAKLTTLFEKLSALLPDSISFRPEEFFTRFSFTAPPSMPVPPSVWENVVKALQTGYRLRIEYAASKEDKVYRVIPVHLANLQGDWYLFAQFDGYDNFRQLALSRIHSARVLKSKGALEGHFDAEEALMDVFARFAGDNQAFSVRVIFSADVAHAVMERQWHPKQTVRPLKDGRVEIRFEAKGDVEVQRWIQAYGRHARVESPKWLKERIQAEAKAVLAVG